MEYSEIKFNCRHFRGDIPCKPNKQSGSVCRDCAHYDPVDHRILIIKLGAAGDVIRTTPLLHRLRKQYPHCHITWITQSPALIPSSHVDKIYSFDFTSVYAVQHQRYDIVINLDKDIEACSLCADIPAKEKLGFIMHEGHIAAVNHHAQHKFITGMFDQISAANTKNYLKEIFEICGFDFQGEPYILPIDAQYEPMWEPIKRLAGKKRIVGLNTGCGERWLTRLWPEEYWVDLIKRLKKNGYFPLLLGGPQEDAQNKKYASVTGAHYPGTFTLQQFMSLSAQCHVIVTAVSMMMHIAIGAGVPLALFNNIFNRHEFELYGNGVIVEPSSGCDCYFGNTCKRERHCMKDLSVDAVYAAIISLINKKP